MLTNTETKRIVVKECTLLAGFLEAMLWAETDNSDESGGEPLDNNYSIADISDESLVKCKLICDRFVDCLSDDYEGDVEFFHNDGSEPNSSQGGHDLYLTIAGHGVGFWDGDWTNGDKLTDLAHEICSDINLNVGDDGKLHVDANIK